MARYRASGGLTNSVQEQDSVSFIGYEAIAQLREATVSSYNVPVARLEEGNVESFKLDPGECAVVPVHWSGNLDKVKCCVTHPNAPAGLVYPGEGFAREYMSVVVENENPLPILITEQDFIAIGQEIEAPTEEACAETL